MKLGDYTFLFNPKYNTYSGKTQFKTFLWNGLFKVMKVPSHSNYILRKTGTHETQCIHRMRLRKFNPHEKVSDFQVDESQFFNDSAVIDEPELFSNETPLVTPTAEAVSSEPEESDHKNSEEIIIHLEPEITQSPKNDNFVHTTPSTQESQHHPAMNLPHNISDGPQPELQPCPAEEENRDTSTSEVTLSELSPISCDVQPEATQQLIEPPQTPEPITIAPCSR